MRLTSCRGPAIGSPRSFRAIVRCAPIIAATLAVACHARTQLGPPMPFEDQGACPLEGCAYGEWTANAGVALKTERWIGAPVAFRVRKGERVTAVTGVVVTHRAGRVRFDRPMTLSSRTGPVHVEPLDTLYLLASRGEGVATAWHKGQVYFDLDGSAFLRAACGPTPNTCQGTIIQKPLSAWWVQVRNAKGQAGWTNQPDRFDGKSVTAGPSPPTGPPRASQRAVCSECAGPA